MVPTRPFPGRLPPSSTPTDVPIRASCDFKMFTPLSRAVWDQTRTPVPKNAFPFPPRIYNRSLHLFMYSGTPCAKHHKSFWEISTVCSYPYPRESTSRVRGRVQEVERVPGTGERAGACREGTRDCRLPAIAHADTVTRRLYFQRHRVGLQPDSPCPSTFNHIVPRMKIDCTWKAIFMGSR